MKSPWRHRLWIRGRCSTPIVSARDWEKSIGRMNSMEKRQATPDEAKALSNPLRLRILRLCLDEALTNKQLADRLEKDPATVLHHVRTLVNTGFLAVEGVRTGAKGALEKPYRSTGKSWRLDVGGAGDATTGFLAVVDAFRDEVL